MNFISHLGRRRDDGASTEPLTTAELLGLRDAALRVGRRWLERCEVTTALYARSRDRAA